MLGYHPEIILAGRRINDGMGAYIGNKTIKQLILAGHDVTKSTVTILGLTFKENCPDLRNSKVIDIVDELSSFGVNVQICDPVADFGEAQKIYGINLISISDLNKADAVIFAVPHKIFLEWEISDFLRVLRKNPVVIDVKGSCDPAIFEKAGINLWRL